MTNLKIHLGVATAAFFAAFAAPAAAQVSESSLTLVAAEEPGTRLLITGTVVDREGRPIAGVRLHVFQTDASGRYTRERPMDEPHARLSGWLRTDVQGRFELRTVRPGGYPEPIRLGGSERKIPAHIHFDVTASGHAQRRLQAVFADDPLLGDPYWKDWVKRLDQPVLAVRATGDTVTAILPIALEPSAPH